MNSRASRGGKQSATRSPIILSAPGRIARSRPTLRSSTVPSRATRIMPSGLAASSARVFASVSCSARAARCSSSLTAAVRRAAMRSSMSASTWRASACIASVCAGVSCRGTWSIAHSVPSGGPPPGASGTPAKKRTRGSPVTSGLSAKRGSMNASWTSNSCSSRIAWAQKATSRGVSVAARPTRALNHCRSSSMRLISAIGVSQMCDASLTTSSKSCSAGVSSSAASASACMRAASCGCGGATFTAAPRTRGRGAPRRAASSGRRAWGSRRPRRARAGAGPRAAGPSRS